MLTPKRRSEFERNLHLVSESLIQKRFFISHHDSHYIRSMTAVRLLPNRRINFHTVNETARLQANTRANMPQMLKMFENDKKQKGL